MEINKIENDMVKIIYNPFTEELEIGDGIKIIEKVSKRGILCQVINEETIDYQSISEEQLRKVVAEKFGIKEHIVEDELSMIDLKNLKIANLKIRKQIINKDGSEEFESWDGWIPSRNSDATRAKNEEILLKLVEGTPTPIRIGVTTDGKNIDIRAMNLDHINVITSVKGAGKSHLAKVLLWKLIKQGASCIVFDLNGEYGKLPKIDDESDKRGIVVAKVGKELKAGIVEFGLDALIGLLEEGQSQKSIESFEAEFRDRFEQFEEANEFVPFSSLIGMLETSTMHQMNRGALIRGLTHLRTLGIFAERPEESSIMSLIEKTKNGGAIILDLSGLSHRTTGLLMPLVTDKIKDVVKSGRYQFLFFEEAHMYLKDDDILDLITRIRHYGATLFFITNTIGKLPETALKQIDNLFLLQLLHSEDIKKVSACGLLDDESIESFARRLPLRNAVIVGKNSTRSYPIRFVPDKLEGITVLGETKHFFG